MKGEELMKSGGAPVDPRTYKIGAEDIIGVRVWREEPLTGAYGVRPDGKISMLLIGEIQAAGLTPQELEANIVEALQKIMNRPQVSVAVLQVNSRKYFVSGEVLKPGQFPLVSKVTVLEAITLSGGVREFGNAKKIVIMRGKERIKFNYSEVLKGKKLEQNIELQPGDIVHVP